MMWKLMYSHVAEVCSKGFNQKWPIIDSGIGLVPKSQQAIIGTSDALFAAAYMRYSSSVSEHKASKAQRF